MSFLRILVPFENRNIIEFTSHLIFLSTFSDDDFFAQLAVDAMLSVKTINPRGELKYPVKAVNILKAHGKSALESIYVKGYALNCTVASQGMPLFCIWHDFCGAYIMLGMKNLVDSYEEKCLARQNCPVGYEFAKNTYASRRSHYD
jgi:hypothetical protein